MFVQWECGCIGLKLKDTCIIISDCCNRISLIFKTNNKKNDDKYSQLGERQIVDLINDIDVLLLDGFKWRAFLKIENIDD